jgi:hypothetical protein
VVPLLAHGLERGGQLQDCGHVGAAGLDVERGGSGTLYVPLPLACLATIFPKITTYIDNDKATQVVTLDPITTDRWYFVSFQRETVHKTVSVGISGGGFQTESYTDDMI